MKKLISAIQFLTILPIGKPGTFDKRMVEFFPIVGLMLGLMLCAFDLAVSRLWSGSVTALLDVILLAILTGSLHLDGLGDTADGLYGNRPKEKALAIMKDSRIGVMGLVAIVCGLSVKWGGIMSLDTHRHLLLVIIPAYARGAMMFGFKYFAYGRPEGGTGHAFFEDSLGISAFWGVLAVAFLSLFAGWRGLLLNLVFVILTVLILLYYKRRMGCITGDMLGAMNEITESVLFLMVSMGGTA
ncbi:adenosylcobinamide-GDP ribazoletransferase [Desulfococcaceae bacterium HSG8]|nr:adenosylcobinamide-GDP ribazoletransferase [Desulfococcaceae bacterium HSG8]